VVVHFPEALHLHLCLHLVPLTAAPAVAAAAVLQVIQRTAAAAALKVVVPLLLHLCQDWIPLIAAAAVADVLQVVGLVPLVQESCCVPGRL
jgi:hypothetical protein